MRELSKHRNKSAKGIVKPRNLRRFFDRTQYSTKSVDILGGNSGAIGSRSEHRNSLPTIAYFLGNASNARKYVEFSALSAFSRVPCCHVTRLQHFPWKDYHVLGDCEARLLVKGEPSGDRHRLRPVAKSSGEIYLNSRLGRPSLARTGCDAAWASSPVMEGHDQGLAVFEEGRRI